MVKVYIGNLKHPEKPGEERTVYRFAPDAESACSWDTREEAERNRAIFDDDGIEVALAVGGLHICSGFRVQQRAPNEFVVFCEVPSLLSHRAVQPA